jgi:signal transduction histidine kinase
MKSLERQLQVNLAITLVLVMALIWLVGSQLPRSLSDEQALQIRGYTSTEATDTAVAPVLEHRQHRFKWLFPFLAAGGIVLILIIQSVVIRRTFRRLDPIRRELVQLETGDIGKLSEAVPAEIYPIIRELNHLLSLMQERMERSRNALGNLAHALKGPLNLLTQYLDQDVPDANSNQQAQLQAERIRQLTERELKRARMAGLGNTFQRFDPHAELPVLVDVLARIYHKSPRCITLDIAPEITRFGDREDMLELIGNLLDNACKWATEHVRCRIHANTRHIHISVEDDGQGRTEAELQQMSQRGIRLDESVEGHGLGLAICQDIVKLYGGTLAFGHSETLGGVRVLVSLPHLK